MSEAPLVEILVAIVAIACIAALSVGSSGSTRLSSHNHQLKAHPSPPFDTTIGSKSRLGGEKEKISRQVSVLVSVGEAREESDVVMVSRPVDLGGNPSTVGGRHPRGPHIGRMARGLFFVTWRTARGVLPALYFLGSCHRSFSFSHGVLQF